MKFTLKPREIDAAQWSGSNWHQMLDFLGRDVVSTNGIDLFLKLPDDEGTLLVNPTEWVDRDRNVYPNDSILSLWEPVEET